MTILEQLDARGFIQDVTAREELDELLGGESVSFYTGYDPTATSLHAGTLVQISLQARLQKAGHKPFVLVGGATGMIGDPSGKSDERNLLDAETLQQNIDGCQRQLSRFLTFGDGPTDAVMVNNADWFAGIGYLEFLRGAGKHITVNYMIAKESVRARLEDRDQGISYTEFSYMLLQAYDFAHLARAHNCTLQVGGSDQWGNITTGIELSRKMGGAKLYGIVTPLLLDATGQKMGKTSTGERVWLDPQLTTPYAFFQYWRNVPDSDVERLLKLFSWRSLEEIDGIAKAHAEAPHKRGGQQALAEDLTTWVHGADATRRVIAAGKVMFGGSLDELEDDDLTPLLADVPSSRIPHAELSAGVALVDLLARIELCKSKGAARRLAKQGGVYINNVRVTDEGHTVTTADLGTETMMVLRAGKKSYHIVQVG